MRMLNFQFTTLTDIELLAGQADVARALQWVAVADRASDILMFH